MATSNYGFSPLPTSQWGSAPSWTGGNFSVNEEIPVPAIGSAAGASPTLPGKTSWLTELGTFGEKLGRGLGMAGAGIAMAKGNPMAGMMMQQFLEDKTGKKVESEDPLAAGKTVASILEKFGVVSPLVLNVGEGTTRML